MGNNQSSNAITNADATKKNVVEEISGEGGQKNRELVLDTLPEPVPAVSKDSSLDLSETDSDSDLDSEDEEDDEGKFINTHTTPNTCLILLLCESCC